MLTPIDPNSSSAAMPFELNRTYEPYSNDPHYIEGNRDFIQRLQIGAPTRVLDLAAGIGTLSRLLRKRLPEVPIVCVDLSHDGNVVSKGLFAADNATGVDFVTASADALPLRDDCVDAVMMGHSIHMIDDADALLRGIRRVLRTGGMFAFNTSFYAGTFCEGTDTIYHDWTREALAYIQRHDARLKAQGKPGVKRKRGKVAAAFSRPWPTVEEWRERLDRHGFTLRAEHVRTVPLTQRSFESIAAYAGFTEVLLSGYPVEIASEALQAAAGPTLAAAGVEEVPRYWLEIEAVAS